MAVNWWTELCCDECGKDVKLYAEEFSSHWPRVAVGVREIRKYAKELGWLRRKGKDYCPDCVEEA